MAGTETFPSRQERLRAFVALKLERRVLRVAVVILLMALVIGGVAFLPGGKGRSILLGKGTAGVERDIGGGDASHYGRRFEGEETANGERFDSRKLTAAHRTLPMGSRVRVTSIDTGRSVVVRINDRGPYAGGRVIDLSTAAARRIGMVRRGTAPVKLRLLVRKRE